MLSEYTREELSAGLDRVVDEILRQAGVVGIRLHSGMVHPRGRVEAGNFAFGSQSVHGGLVQLKTHT